MPLKEALPQVKVCLVFSSGHRAQMCGWESTLEDAECGYAWHDKDQGQWLHSPPRVVQGQYLSSVEIKILTDQETTEVIDGKPDHYIIIV